MSPSSVFISHRSTKRGQEVAGRLYDMLKDRHIDSFLDIEKLKAGDLYASEIQESIRQARVVVVFFDDELTSWLHFEAACGFFDRKLVPVSIQGSAVPPPYDQVQLEVGGSDEALERVVEQIERRLGARKSAWTRSVSWLNGVFGWGAWIVVVAVATILIAIGQWGTGQGALFLAGLFGGLVVGGQFFLSLAFSGMALSPSFRERDFAFKAVRRLTLIWAPMVVVPASLAVLWVLGASGSDNRTQPWAFLAFAAYSSAVFIFGVGYFVVKESAELDAIGKDPDRVARLRFLANTLFSVAFFGLAWAVSLVVLRDIPTWIVRLSRALGA
jgi:hypothetical protein